MLSPQRFHGAQSFNPHMATMPNLHDPFMSPPMVSNNHFSAPNTPEVLRAARSGMDMLSLGSTATSAMDNSSTIDPMLGSWNYGDQPFSPTSIASDFHSEGGFGFDGIDEDVHDTIELSGSYKGN